VIIVLVVGALAFVATKALSDAALFFYNADEAVAKRDELGDSRFRLQGTVQDGSIVNTGDGVDFVVAFNGVSVAVSHRGDPPELFDEGEPVVLEGRWDRSVDVFASDRMLVKHDEQYDAVNQDRIREAEQGGSVPASSP
jgi:cytochrome c-type biogenesis protein CcmE